jgi:hypothetical protein
VPFSPNIPRVSGSGLLSSLLQLHQETGSSTSLGRNTGSSRNFHSPRAPWYHVNPRMSRLPEPGLSSHEPNPKLSVFWVYFSPGPLGRSIPCLFRSRPSLSRVCIGLGPRIPCLHRPRPLYSVFVWVSALWASLSQVCIGLGLFPIVSSSQSTHSIAQFSSIPNSRDAQWQHCSLQPWSHLEEREEIRRSWECKTYVILTGCSTTRVVLNLNWIICGVVWASFVQIKRNSKRWYATPDGCLGLNNWHRYE